MLLNNKLRKSSNYHVIIQDIVVHNLDISKVKAKYPFTNDTELFLNMIEYLSIQTFDMDVFKPVVNCISTMNVHINTLDLMQMMNTIIMYFENGNEKTNLILNILNDRLNGDILSYVTFNYFNKNSTETFISFLNTQFNTTNDKTIINILTQIQMNILNDFSLLDYLQNHITKTNLNNIIIYHMQKRILAREEFAICIKHIDVEAITNQVSKILTSKITNEKLVKNIMNLLVNNIDNEILLNSLKEVLESPEINSKVKINLLDFFSSYVSNDKVFFFIKNLDYNKVLEVSDYQLTMMKGIGASLVKATKTSETVFYDVLLPLMLNHRNSGANFVEALQDKMVIFNLIQPIMSDKYIDLVYNLGYHHYGRAKTVHAKGLEILVPYIGYDNKNIYSYVNNYITSYEIDEKLRMKILNQLILHYDNIEYKKIFLHFIERFHKFSSRIIKDYETLIQNQIILAEKYHIINDVFAKDLGDKIFHLIVSNIDLIHVNNVIIDIFENELRQEKYISTNFKIIEVLYKYNVQSLTKYVENTKKSNDQKEKVSNVICNLLLLRDDTSAFKKVISMDKIKDGFYKKEIIEYVLLSENFSNDIKIIASDSYFNKESDINEKYSLIERFVNKNKTMDKIVFNHIISIIKKYKQKYMVLINEKLDYYHKKDIDAQEIKNILSVFEQ